MSKRHYTLEDFSRIIHAEESGFNLDPREISRVSGSEVVSESIGLSIFSRSRSTDGQGFSLEDSGSLFRIASATESSAKCSKDMAKFTRAIAYDMRKLRLCFERLERSTRRMREE